MTTGWVAAGVRATAMARRRAGAGAAALAARQPDLAAALALLDGTPAAAWLDGHSTVAAAERAGREELLWSVRVLAGWLPARGTGVLRALAAGFERNNLLDLATALDDPSATVPEPYELGALGTVWGRAREVRSASALRDLLRASAWGDPGEEEERADVLSVSWLVRVARSVPGTRAWARDGAALVAARRLLVEAPPSERLAQVARPLLGSRWLGARSLDALHGALPHDAELALAGVTGPADLWRAEAALRGRVQAEGLTLLHTAASSPQVVVGAVAVLAVDTWRVVAALAAAASGGAGLEVLDAVA